MRKGGGDIKGGYDDDFQAWWSQQVPAFEQFPYAGLDFRGDTELMLPPGEAWGDIGTF